MNSQNHPEESDELRRNTQQEPQTTLFDAEDLSLQDAKRLIHDLHVHQIELEVQNEQLRITQLALEASRRKYSDLYEFSPVGLLTLDQDERIQEVNLTFVTMLGLDREKLIKRHLSQFIDKSAQDTYHFFYQALRTTQEPQQCEITLIPTNGIPLVLKVDGIVLSQTVDSTTYRIAATDITERSQSEQEIRRLYSAEQAARAHSDRIVQRIISLQQVTATLSNAVSYEQIFEVCLQQSMPVIAARRGDIMLRPTEGTPFQLKGSYDLRELTVSQIEAPVTLFAQVQTQQEPIQFLSLEAYLQFYPEASQTPLHDITAFATLPLIVNDDTIGLLSYGFLQPQALTQEDEVFIQVIAQQCAQALQRIRLSEQARDLATLKERQRLSRDLHDSVKQSIFAAMTLSESLPRIWERDVQLGKAQLEQVIILNRAALAQMQVLLLELRPESIVKTHLSTLLRQLSSAVQGHLEIDAKFDLIGVEPDLPPDVHITLYRIAQECLNNILKHSQATQFGIQLINQSNETTLIIRDNGVGFDPAQLSPGMGINGMQERAAGIGADLRITNLVTGGVEVKRHCTGISPR